LFFCSFCIFAQEDVLTFDPYLQVQNASPEAEKYNQLSEIPVDLYTGRVNIEIPLYTIIHNDIKVPISISYMGGGIKVAEESGLVGLGWKLNASGVISRVLRGMPDELYDNANRKAGYRRMGELILPDGVSEFSDYINLIKSSNQDRDPIALGHPVSQKDLNKVYMIGLYQDKYDEMRFESSQDNYMFNVNGLSGSFAYANNHLILQSNSGCSVDFDNSNPIIRDAHGFRYSFKALERKDYLYKNGFIYWDKESWDNAALYRTDYTSAWWLTQIKSMSGDSVGFSYTDLKIGHRRPEYHGYTQVEDFYYNALHGTIESRNQTHLFHSEYYEHKDSVKHKLLDIINFHEGHVKFYYAPVDEYHSYTPHVDSISIFASNSPIPIRRVHFSYYGGDGKELLTGITILGSSGERQKYSFTYHKPLFIPLTSESYDHWGYYSSVSDGFFPGGTYFDIPVDYSGKNRYADNYNAYNNMLSTITYPSGGVTSLVWEPHDFSVYSILGQQVIHESADPDQSTQQTYVMDSRHTLCGKENHEQLIATATLNSNSVVRIDLTNYYNYANNNSPSSNNGYADCIYNSTYFPSIKVSKNNQEITRINITKDITNYNGNRVRTLSNLSAGTYEFRLVNPREGLIHGCYDYEWIFNMYGADTSLDGTLNIEVGHYQSGTSGSEIKNSVGGVRIKRITYNSGQNESYTKEYTYKTDDGISSGVLAYPPRYASKRSYCDTVIVPGNNPHGTAGEYIVNCPDMVTLRSNGLPYVLNSDGHIGYKQVTEETTHNNVSVNKIVYKYQTADIMGSSDLNDTEHFYECFTPTDMMQLTSQSYLRGHLKEKIEYTDECRTTHYFYDIQEKADNDTLTGAIFSIAEYHERDMFAYNGNMIKPYKDVGIVKYRIIPYNKRLSRAISTGEKSDDFHSYTYSNDSYSAALNANMPVTHSTINSEGDTIIQHFTYHMGLNKVKTCVTSKNGYVIDAYRYEYDSSGRIINRYITPLRAYSLPLYSSFDVNNDINELVESFTYYNNRLSERTEHLTNTTTVYLWSYINSYPVAEIENSTFNEVRNIVGNLTVDVIAFEVNPDMSVLNNLRSALPQSRVTTRTYRPLIGMTSETDQAGNTTYYDYDGFGRLHTIYLMNNGSKEIIKQYEYHLSTENNNNE